MHKIIPIILAGAVLAACDGATTVSTHSSLTSSGDTSNSLSDHSSSSAEATPLSTIAYKSQRGLKQLTRKEYFSSIETLIGETLPSELKNNFIHLGTFVNGFAHGTPYHSDDSVISRLAETAEAIATSQWLLQALPLALREDTALFKRYLLHSFLFQAFRRPPTNEEKEQYADLIDRASSTEEAIQYTMMAVFSAPQFIYRSELGISTKALINSGWQTFPKNASDYVKGADFQLLTPQQYGNNNLLQAPFTFDAALSGPTWLTFNFEQIDSTLDNLQFNLSVNGSPVSTFQLLDDALQSPDIFVNTGEGDYTISLSAQDVGNSNTANLFINTIQISSAIKAKLPNIDSDTNKLTIFGKSLVSNDDTYILDPFEYATHLAFMYTGRTPEAWLLHAALKGQLDERESTKQIINQLIDSPAGKEHLGDFAVSWTMGTLAQRSSSTFGESKELTSDIYSLFQQEIQEQFWHVFYNEDLPFSEYLAADYTFANKQLADYYHDIDGTLLDDNFIKIATTYRGGPIASGAFMTASSHADSPRPILRAGKLRARFFCQGSASEPLLIDGERERLYIQATELQEAEQGLTTTRFFEAVTDGPICDVCHEYALTPLFAMNDFNALGQLLRRDDNGTVWEPVSWNGATVDKPVEAMDRGVIYGLDQPTIFNLSQSTSDGIEFRGAKDLSEKIAEHPTVERCMIRNALEFTEGRHFIPHYPENSLTPDQKNTHAIVDDLYLEFKRNNKSIRSVFNAIGLSDAVRFRTDHSIQ